MKWGIRKDRLTTRTKNGETITLKEHPDSIVAKFLGKYLKSVAENIEKTAMFDIKDSNGKKVGDITLYKESEDSINVVWVSTKKSSRGKGYGTAVMETAIQIAKDTGAKQVTLEVPGISLDAKHIYEKLGFVATKDQDIDEDDVWGGLTRMKLDLKHGMSLGPMIPVSKSEAALFMNTLAKEMNKMDELQHYGVLGMRWGIRKDRSGGSRRTKGQINPSEDSKRATALRSKSVSEMSNNELRELINRMNLEQQYSNLLNSSEKKKGQSIVKDILKEVGKEVAKDYIKKGIKAGVKTISEKWKNA